MSQYDRDRDHSTPGRSASTNAVQRTVGKRTLVESSAPVQMRSMPAEAKNHGETRVDAEAPAAASPPAAEWHGINLFGSAVQRRATGAASADAVHAAAAHGVNTPTTALPHAAAIQESFGPAHDVSKIQAHVGGETAAACHDMGASAFASGNHVAFAEAPDLHTAAHEAAHVVQQARGVSLYGGVGVAGDAHEQHADAVADRVVARESAADLLDGPASGSATTAVQKQEATPSPAAATPAGGAALAASTTPAASETPAAGGASAAGSGPQGICTEFGDFNIYPDDFIGPLPVATRASGPWAIRRSNYDNLISKLTSVRAGTSKVIVGGTAAFKVKVYVDLGWLMTSGPGQELINQLTARTFTLTINETTGGNETSYDPDADSWERPDGTPGPGANITVGYNTVETNPYGGTDAWMTRPPAIGLAHEMVHAWTGIYGTRARGNDAAGVRRRENQATGLGEWANARLSENRFRAAFGLPLRPTY
jgi:Effector protein/Domain of unknown function (DUF4157)